MLIICHIPYNLYLKKINQIGIVIINIISPTIGVSYGHRWHIKIYVKYF